MEEAQVNPLMDAVKLIVSEGIDLELRNWHLYKTPNEKEYVVLEFDDKANALDCTEERFPNTADGLHDAVAKFIQRSGKPKE